MFNFSVRKICSTFVVTSSWAWADLLLQLAWDRDRETWGGWGWVAYTPLSGVHFIVNALHFSPHWSEGGT